MRPLNHLVTSSVFSFLLALALAQDALPWVVAGAIAGTVIDIDHLIILLLYDRKSFRRVFGFRNIDAFNVEFANHRNFNAVKNVTHALQGVAVFALFVYSGAGLLIPAFASMFLHLLADIVPQIYMRIELYRLAGKYGSCSSCLSKNNLEVHGKVGRTPFVLVCAKCHKRLHSMKDPYGKKVMSNISRRRSF